MIVLYIWEIMRSCRICSTVRTASFMACWMASSPVRTTKMCIRDRTYASLLGEIRKIEQEIAAPRYANQLTRCV